MYESFVFNEMATHLDNFLSKLKCQFNEGFSSQQSLIVIVQKWRKKIKNKGGSFSALIADLSKAFDCLLFD